MGFALLWIESLAVTLLLVALVLACVARWKSGGARAVVWILTALVPLALYGGLAAFAGVYAYAISGNHGWLYFASSLACVYLAGVVSLRLYAIRNKEIPEDSVAANWPRGKLAIAFAVALTLHLITYANIDLAAQQHVSTLRAEAGALALSVAPARIADAENAAIMYQQAFELMESKEKWPHDYQEEWELWTDFDLDNIDADDPKLSQFIKQQTPILTLFRQAAEKPNCRFEREYGRPSINMLLPEYGHMRSATRLLAIDARYHAKRGDTHLAIQDINTMFRVAEHSAADPLLIAMLVTCALDHLAVDTLEAILQQNKPSGDDLAELNIDGSLSLRRAFSRSMRMEQAFGTSCFCDLALGHFPLSELTGDSNGIVTGVDQYSIYRIFLLADDLSAYRSHMNQYSQLASQPYWEAKKGWEEQEDELLTNAGGLLTRMLLPALAKAAETVAKGDARRQSATLASATLRYRAEHDRFPKDLDELIPEQIIFVPRDPFDGKPMKMKVTDDELVIYSVGPDQTDDGGTSLDEDKKTGDITFRLPLKP